MAYNFTEKKRIRKSFAKKTSLLDVPYLLETQLASYKAFLQKDASATERKTEGLQAAFESVFPISSHNGLFLVYWFKFNGFLCGLSIMSTELIKTLGKSTFNKASCPLVRDGPLNLP